MWKVHRANLPKADLIKYGLRAVFFCKENDLLCKQQGRLKHGQKNVCQGHNRGKFGGRIVF